MLKIIQIGFRYSCNIVTVCVKDYGRFYINIQNKIIVCAYKFYSIIGGRKFERHATTTQTSGPGCSKTG